MNRFVNLSTSQFDPLNWEEVARVPLAKRAQHDSMLQAKAEMETSLAQIDSRDVHSDEVRLYQDHMRNQLNNLSQQLASEGVNYMNKGQILKLNSDYKQAMSPQGRMGRIAASKADLDAKKKAFYADKTGHSKEGLDKMWNQIQGEQTGYDDDNNIKDVDEAGAFAYKDIPLYIEGVLSKAASDVESKYGSGYGIEKDPKSGLYVMVNRKNNQIVKENDSQITAAINELNTFLSDNTNDYGKNVELYGYDIPTLVDQKAQKHLFRQETGQSSTSASLIPGQLDSNKNNTNTNNNPTTPSITSESTKTTSPLTGIIDYKTKIKDLDTQIESSTDPLIKSEAIKSKRHYQRLHNAAMSKVKNNPKYTVITDEYNKDIENLNLQQEELVSNFDSDKAGFKLQDVTKKVYSSGATWGTIYSYTDETGKKVNVDEDDFPEVKDYIKNTEKIENRSSVYDDNLNKIYEPIVTTLANETTKLSLNFDKKADSSNYWHDLKNDISIDSFAPTMVISNGESIPLAESTKVEAISILNNANTKITGASFYTDPSTRQVGYIVNLTPPDGSALNDKTNDGYYNTKFDGTQSVEMFLPVSQLYDSNTGLPHTSSKYIHNIKDPIIKEKMMNEILTSNLSATPNIEDVGNNAMTPQVIGNYLGSNIANLLESKKTKGVDFYHNAAGYTQMYAIDDKGNKGPITFNNLFDLNNKTSLDNTFGKIEELGIMKDIIDMSKNTSISRTDNTSVYSVLKDKMNSLSTDDLTITEKEKIADDILITLSKLPISFKSIGQFRHLNKLANL